MITFTKHAHWNHVKSICEKLHENGYVAWLAGGCVRDGLLNFIPHDFDVATNAQVADIEQLFEKTIGVGKAFGVLRVVIPPIDIEVATFRKDGPYSDGRRPATVAEASPEEDAHRRDFTINALFFDPFSNEVKDFVNGKKDLKARLIRTVGRAEDRFQEDHLRIMRAVRFVSQLDFNLEEKTQKAVTKLSNLVPTVSGERIFAELQKMLKGRRPDRGIKLLHETHILENIMSEVKYAATWPGLYRKIVGSPHQETMGWIILFHGTPEGDREKVYGRLRFSNDLKGTIEGTIAGIEKLKIFKELSLADQKEVSAQKTTGLALEYLDLTSPAPPLVKKFVHAHRTLPPPWLKSHHLEEMGIKPGKEMGVLLAKAYEAQLSELIKDPDGAIDWIKQKIKRT
jgi:tRNA nucleotidyltransferase/poly(A) polymerase